MKNLWIILPILLLTAFGANGQGYVYASNLTQDGLTEQVIYDWLTGNALDSSYYAQLFAGPANSLEATLKPIDNPVQFFDNPAGDFFGGEVAIYGDGIVPGSTVTLQVRVWSVAAGATWEQACAAALVNPGYQVGKSSLFQNLTGSLGNAAEIAPNLNPNLGFRCIPEPGASTLGGLGVGFLLLRRGRRP